MTNKITPTKPKENLYVAGKKVPVGEKAVASEPGTSSETLIKELKRAAKREVFPFSPRFINE